MTSPLICKSCGFSLGDKWEVWCLYRPEDDHSLFNKQKQAASDILDAINVKRKCCRIMMLTANDLLPLINKYKRPNIHQKTNLKI